MRVRVHKKPRSMDTSKAAWKRENSLNPNLFSSSTISNVEIRLDSGLCCVISSSCLASNSDCLPRKI